LRPLARRKPEMEVEYFEPPAAAEIERGMLAAAANPAVGHGEVDVALGDDRKTGQERVAVIALLEFDVEAKGDSRQTQRFGQLHRQVQAARARCPMVDLLEQHDVRGVMGDYLRGPLEPEPAIDPDPLVRS